MLSMTQGTIMSAIAPGKVRDLEEKPRRATMNRGPRHFQACLFFGLREQL